MNGKAFTVLNTCNLSELSRNMALKNPYRWQTVRFKLLDLQGEENHYSKEAESLVFSGFGVSISRGWERKSTTGRFATGRFWPFTWKTSFVGKDKVNRWEFCKLKITTIVVICNHNSTHFSISKSELQRTLRLLFGDCRLTYFHLTIGSYVSVRSSR